MSTDLSTALSQLRMAGKELPRKLSLAIRAADREAVAPLIAIVSDYPGDDPDADENRYWATYHAIRLLGDLGAIEAIDPLLRLLDEDDDYIEHDLPEALAKIGPPAVDALRAALFAPDADIWGAARAAEALKQIAQRHPELRSELVGMLIERIDADVSSDEPDTLAAFVISDLADLRAVEAIPSVRQAYESDLVDTTVINLKTFEALVGRPEGMSPGQALWPETPQVTGWSSGGLTSGLLAPAAAQPTDTRLSLPFGRKIGRNEPCPCGSGKKYKRCHGA